MQTIKRVGRKSSQCSIAIIQRRQHKGDNQSEQQTWIRFFGKDSFSLEWKIECVMDDDSGDDEGDEGEKD